MTAPLTPQRGDLVRYTGDRTDGDWLARSATDSLCLTVAADGTVWAEDEYHGWWLMAGQDVAVVARATYERVTAATSERTV